MIVSRETSRTRKTPVVSRETLGIFTARRVIAAPSIEETNPRSHSSATTPTARSTTGQPRLATWIRKSVHQRAMSTNEAPTMFNNRPPPHDPDPEERPPTKCTHLRRASTIQGPINEGHPSPKTLTNRSFHQQTRSATEPINHEQRTPPGALPASRPGPGRARRGGGRTPRRGRRSR